MTLGIGPHSSYWWCCVLLSGGSRGSWYIRRRWFAGVLCLGLLHCTGLDSGFIHFSHLALMALIVNEPHSHFMQLWLACSHGGGIKRWQWLVGHAANISLTCKQPFRVAFITWHCVLSTDILSVNVVNAGWDFWTYSLENEIWDCNTFVRMAPLV